MFMFTHSNLNISVYKYIFILNLIIFINHIISSKITLPFISAVFLSFFSTIPISQPQSFPTNYLYSLINPFGSFVVTKIPPDVSAANP